MLNQANIQGDFEISSSRIPEAIKRTLASVLKKDEVLKEIMLGHYCNQSGVLVATNYSIFFVYSDLSSLPDSFSYHGISQVENRKEFVEGGLRRYYEYNYFAFQGLSDDPTYLTNYLLPALKRAGNQGWRLRNSLFMLFALIPAINFIPFFIMGYRAKRKKFYSFSLLYGMPFLLSVVFGFELTNDKFFVFFLASWFIGMVHMICTRDSYLKQWAIEEEILEARFPAVFWENNIWKRKKCRFMLWGFLVVPLPFIFNTITMMTKRKNDETFNVFSFFIIWVGLIAAIWFPGILSFILSFSLLSLLYLYLARNDYLLYVAIEEAPFSKMLDGERRPPSDSPEESRFSGDYYIQKMQQLNVAITDQTVSDYLDEMEKVCKDIFDHVEKHPEKAKQIDHFLNYYLPETFKLLKQYDELDDQAVKSEIVTQSMREISDMLAVILGAFRNLYNQLFQEEALHIKTDIQVLKDVLTQHGLTEESQQFTIQK